MDFLDVLLGILLCYGMYNGFKNGLFVALASFISLILGIFIAIKFSFIVKSFLESQFGWNSKFIQIVAFGITFLMVVFGLRLLAKVFTKIADFAFLGWLNKLGGAVFSVLKMILLLSVALNLFQKININNYFIKKETIDKSLFFNPILEISELVYPSLKGWYEDLKTK